MHTQIRKTVLLTVNVRSTEEIRCKTRLLFTDPNMTFENMKAYIATQPNAKELRKEFDTMKERSKIQKSPYQYMLSWFEAKFDGYNDLDQFMAEKEAERKAKEAEKAAEKAAAEADETADEEEND